MTVETNKRLVEDFFAKVSASDLTQAYALIHDDVAWWSAGGENLAFSGTLSKSAFMDSMNGMSAIFSKGPEFAVTSMVAEGDRVAVGLSGHALLKDGRSYDNLYHLLLTIRDGKIIAAREHHDTLYAKIVLVDGQSSKSPV